MLVALVVIDSFADLLATARGLKVTPTVQVAPAGRLAGQSLVWANQAAAVPMIEMPVTLNDTAPLLVSVTVCAGLVAPTLVLPNFRLVGLTDAAGVTFSTLDLVIEFAVPLSVVEVFASTGLVVTSKVVDDRPCGTTMLAATGDATPALLLDRSTVTGPGPALHSSFAVPTTG
jgi:hypothetical protein